MSFHRLAIGAAALLGIITVSAASAPPPLIARDARALAGSSALAVFGGRSAAQLQSAGGRKFDSALAGVASHLGLVRPDHELEDLHSLNPAVHFAQLRGSPPLVAVDVVTRGDPQRLKTVLASLGLTHAAVFRNDVGGWLPVSALDAAAARSEVHSIRAALWHTRDVLATQGDFAQGSAALRTSYSTLTGAGVTVGVLSDSYDCYHVYGQPGSGVPASGANGYASNGFTADAEQDMSSGALPSAGVSVLAEAPCLQYGAPVGLPFGDEGRAMLQIVHAVAPGATLSFYTGAVSEADMATGIAQLAAAGAKVIADDIGWFDEPFFQDGLLAQAIDSVNAQGVAYFSAAGNDGNLGYDNLHPSFSTAGTGSNAGEMLLNFDTSGATTAPALTISVPSLVPGEFIAAVLEWDQPYVTGAPTSPGASSQLDLCVTGASGYTIFDNATNNSSPCTGLNSLGSDPVQYLIIGNPANATGNSAATNITLVVGLKNGSPPPGRIKLAWEDDGAGSTINNFPTNTATLQGHPGAATAAAVGAVWFLQAPACGLVTSAQLEPYSALGGAPILFDDAGNRLASEDLRQKPDFTAADGVNNTFLGFTYGSVSPPIVDNSTVAGCADDAGAPNFFGTSAATPHAAGLAALMLQANSAATPAQIYQALRATASAMGTVPDPANGTYNFDSGYGFIDATAAMAALPAGAPQISLSSDAINVGDSSTLTWLAVNASACTASGSWSGAKNSSGTQTVTPTQAGSDTYTLTCTTSAGPKSASAVLTVGTVATQPPPSSGGGGGGALGIATLLALGGLTLAQLQRARRARRTRA